MNRKIIFFIIILIFLFACSQDDNEYIENRDESIPENAVKVLPDDDVFPPVLLSSEFEEPKPLSEIINTAGAEDSPFIDGDTLYFFFTPDVNVPADKQLIDGVTGIWFSIENGSSWSDAKRIVLNDDVALDGAVCINNDTMWFASVRSGNYGEVDIYKAIFNGDKWIDWKNAGQQLNSEYDIGELHITNNSDTMYFGWENDEGYGSKDIWYSVREGDNWSYPKNCGANINDELNQDQPFITKDGSELWFTGQSKSGYTGPSVYRCLKTDSGWGKVEEIIANFAGEPTLDNEGNVYFVHHFYNENIEMIEADIYIAIRK